jgi:hypothetical protein
MIGSLKQCPQSAQGLEINAVADGYIVYQPERDRVHYLNPTAALILELCNGRNAETELPELLQSAFDLSAPPADEVKACLQTLRGEGLIL